MDLDRKLITAAQDGDRRALERLLGQHQDRIYAICRRLTGNDADAYDATQEALIAIVQGLSRFDHRSAFSTWVYRVATNACLDELRRRSRRPVPGLDTEQAEATGLISTHRPTLEVTVTDRLTIDEAIMEIHPDFAAAVVLRDQMGFNYAEIAEILGIPVGTVRSRIARGRAALAQRLRPPPIVGNHLPGSDVQPSSHD